MYRMLVGYSVKLAAVTALYIYMYLENKRRDRNALEGETMEDDGVENGMLVSGAILSGLYILANSHLGSNGARQPSISICAVA